MGNAGIYLKELWHREGITIMALLGMLIMLGTLVYGERPGAPESEEEFYRRIGIEGVDRIAANRRNLPTLQMGDLIRFQSGNMMVVRRIARDAEGVPTVIGAETATHRMFSFDARSERCLSQITAIISQADHRHEILLAALEGRMPE